MGEDGWEESEAQMSEVLSSWEGEVIGVCSEAREVGDDIEVFRGDIPGRSAAGDGGQR